MALVAEFNAAAALGSLSDWNPGAMEEARNVEPKQPMFHQADHDPRIVPLILGASGGNKAALLKFKSNPHARAGGL